jgi:hypothetical protein
MIFEKQLLYCDIRRTYLRKKIDLPSELQTFKYSLSVVFIPLRPAL